MYPIWFRDPCSSLLIAMCFLIACVQYLYCEETVCKTSMLNKASSQIMTLHLFLKALSRTSSEINKYVLIFRKTELIATY